MRKNKNLLIDAAILFALASIGAGAYWFSPLLLPKSDITVPSDPGCDLHSQACVTSLPGQGQVRLSITPHPIPMLQPLVVKVDVSDIDAKSVAVDFAGIGMNMGYNRPTLTQVEPGHFVANASLPVCITGTMSWQVTVMLETGFQHISIPFRFDSKPH